MNNKKVEQAVRILDEYFAGKLPENLEARVRRWLSDERHRREKDLALRILWDKRVAKDCNPGQYAFLSWERICEHFSFPEEEKIANKKKTRIPRRNLLLRVAAIVIPVLILAGITGVRMYNAQKEPVWITLSAQSGAQEHHLLPDGSEVWINPRSEVAYRRDFTRNREIRLTGEAFFRVTPDEKKAFQVQTKELQVVVHGTEFMVTAIEGKDRNTVTLHSGSVEVEAGQTAKKLEPGEQLQYYPGTNEIRVEEVVLEDWTKPSLDFYSASLEEIFYSLQVNFNVEFICGEPLPQETKYTIRFAADQDVGQIVRILSVLTQCFTYEMEGRTVEVTFI